MVARGPKPSTLPGQVTLFDKDTLRGEIGPTALARVRGRCLVCRNCKLWSTRTQVVFGEGECEMPPLAFVGEGPGFHEDKHGRPFIGPSGMLLDRMVAAMGYVREQVYITNSVCCRPPENRKPEADELEPCREHLLGQLRAIRPRAIILLGATAARSLLRAKEGVMVLRGRWFEWEDTPVRVTFHPAFLLREPSRKHDAWVDLKLVLAQLAAPRSDP